MHICSVEHSHVYVVAHMQLHVLFLKLASRRCGGSTPPRQPVPGNGLRPAVTPCRCSPWPPTA